MKTNVFQERNLFSHTKAQRHKGALFALMLIALTAFLVIGCSEQKESGTLHGTWSDGFGTMIINTSAETIEYVDNYIGNIVNSPDFNASFGVLIIEFTHYIEYDYSNYPEVTSVENPDNVGKFGALYWRNLTLDSVLMADAYTEYTHTMFDTLEEAQTEFTLDKEYVNWGMGLAPYTK